VGTNKDEGLQKLEEVRQLTRGALAEMRTLLSNCARRLWPTLN